MIQVLQQHTSQETSIALGRFNQFSRRFMANRSPPWLVLLYHFSQDPGSLRVKIWRRLQAIGAISLKGSVYVLPMGSQAQEDFEWLLREVQNGGGEGAIAEAEFVSGMSDSQVQSLFDQARQGDYLELADEIRTYIRERSKGKSKGSSGSLEPGEALARFRRKLSEIESIDFFGATGRESVGALLREIEDMVESASGTDGEPPVESRAVTPGSTWVTRANVFVDRIASAWLIRRWIDPKAVFKFTSEREYRAGAGEVRFDMFDAEFTHQGDRCTFEVLCTRFGLHEAALERIGQIVHDIDLKDNKYGRQETAGIAHLISGIAARIDGDPERIERGSQLFDDLYQSFRTTSRK
jgi:hypothetical protein